ncbi:MAG: DUF975 family protein [Clostridia bacterium]|nr:DUF975 family protein [Clostridia bacterium]
MNVNKNFKELKELSKEQLLGNYGVLAGASFLVLTIFYALFLLIYFVTIGASIASPFSISTDTNLGSLSISILFFVLYLIVNAIMSVMITGVLRMTLEISRGNAVKIKDMFFCFSHHPDKVLIIFFLSFFLSFIFSLPSMVLQYYYTWTTPSANILTSDIAILYLVLYVAGLIAQIIVSLNLAFSYFVYLDHPEFAPIECLKESCHLMTGHKIRFLLFELSFIGWFFLLFLSCGMAVFWFLPYFYISAANFYRDVINDHATKIDITIDDHTPGDHTTIYA